MVLPTELPAVYFIVAPFQISSAEALYKGCHHMVNGLLFALWSPGPQFFSGWFDHMIFMTSYDLDQHKQEQWATAPSTAMVATSYLTETHVTMSLAQTMIY